MSQERRHFARIHFDAGAEFFFGDRRSKVKVLDLSFRGALIEVPFDPALIFGTACTLTLPLAGGAEGDCITMGTEIAHIKGRHLGLLCRSIDLDSVTHLRHLIEFNLGDASLLDRELKALVAA